MDLRETGVEAELTTRVAGGSDLLMDRFYWGGRHASAVRVLGIVPICLAGPFARQRGISDCGFVSVAAHFACGGRKLDRWSAIVSHRTRWLLL